MTPALRRDFLLPKDDICNIGEPVILSIYHQFSDIWFSGKYEILEYFEQPQDVEFEARNHCGITVLINLRFWPLIIFNQQPKMERTRKRPPRYTHPSFQASLPGYHK